MSYPPPAPQAGYYPPPPQKRHVLRNVLLFLAGVIVLIIVIAVATSGASTGTPPAVTPPPAAATTAPASPASPQYTASQQQAIDAAGGYLNDGQGFSRAGLIQQLSSPDGNGFSAADATFAVSHVKADWDQQAAIAARAYMSDGEGFSYSSLVQQLESADGSQFTYAQAVYGAKAAGLLMTSWPLPCLAAARTTTAPDAITEEGWRPGLS